jgi:hypothetical protein
MGVLRFDEVEQCQGETRKRTICGPLLLAARELGVLTSVRLVFSFGVL